MINELLLLSGNDIPFNSAKLICHQPSAKQIAFIGEDVFFSICELITVSKKSLIKQDKINLQNITDFEVLMAIINADNEAARKTKYNFQMVLFLLFPNYTINFLPNSIMFSIVGENNETQRYLIDKDNFKEFKEIFQAIFCLKEIFSSSGGQYNPGGPQARALVQKFKKRQKKLAEMRKDKQKTSIIARYISILSVGTQKSIKELLSYTLYQLFDEFNRFRKKQEFDLYVSAKMAGAKDLEEVKNWMS